MLAMKEINRNMKERSVKQEGFISTAFLIVMCTMMSLIAAKADYIYKADTIFKKLEEYEELFEAEAQVLTYAKCVLIREDTLDDFVASGMYVSVYNSADGYDLYFLDYIMEINVYDKQIVNFTVKRLN